MTVDPVIPYATRRPARQGLRLATILTLFALVQCVRDTPFYVQQLSFLSHISSQPTVPGEWMPGAFEWIDRWFNLICSLLLGFSAILLIAGPNFGRRLFFGVSAAHLLGMSAFNVAFVSVSSSWAKFSLASKLAGITAYSLYTISNIVLIWLLWIIVSNPRPHTSADPLPSRRVGRASLLYMLSLGASSLVSQLILFVQAHAEYHTSFSYDNIVLCTAAAVLVVAASWGLLETPGGVPACLGAVVLWCVHPLIFAIWTAVKYHQLGLIWHSANLSYVHWLTATVPQSVLLILLLCHPRIWGRRRKTGRHSHRIRKKTGHQSIRLLRRGVGI